MLAPAVGALCGAPAAGASSKVQTAPLRLLPSLQHAGPSFPRVSRLVRGKRDRSKILASVGAPAGQERGDEKPRRGAAHMPTAELALGLASRFKVVQRPASWNVRYSVAVQDFIEVSILAFECGHSEESLRNELHALGAERFPFAGEEDEESFYSMVSIAWLTLGMAPRATITRWGTTPAVSEESTRHWKGFVQLIVDAYFEKRMAWYPTEPLQMEVMASRGRQAHPADVSEWMRLVYTTLECTLPQFPR